jgi:hypothetical protein
MLDALRGREFFRYESPANCTTAASDFRISSPRIVL